MAKKLINDYVFTPGSAGAGTIVLDGNYSLETLLIITNVTDNIIIYNFAGSGTGGSVTYNSLSNKTTLTLDVDTSSMSSSDNLQIFSDTEFQEIDFSSTYIDPVGKLRVSSPENLIDTDFEYGLQGTKWETLELVNNLPAFYSSIGEYILSDIVSVSTLMNSSLITVTTRDLHGLSIGTPIDVSGLSSRTAEGKFIIVSVPTDTTFTYKSKSSQGSSADISGDYTIIVPGSFYATSNINYNKTDGIVTDGANQSNLSIKTDYKHGFEPESSIYLTNTIGKNSFQITSNTSSNAPDGHPYIDPVDTATSTPTIDPTKTETRQMTGTKALKFNASAVSVSSNTITWNNHEFQPGDVLLYCPPSGDTEIGGLARLQIYYVKSVPNTNTFTLCEKTNGNFTANAEINFTNAGTYNYGRGLFVFGYEIRYGRMGTSTTATGTNGIYSWFATRFSVTGSGSGHDLTTQKTASNGEVGYFGLGGKEPDRHMFVGVSDSIYTFLHPQHFSNNVSSNMNLGDSNYPDGYDFIEDYDRWENYRYSSNVVYGSNKWSFSSIGNASSYSTPLRYTGGWQSRNNNDTFAAARMFLFFLDFDAEADSFYAENHGMNTGATGTFTTSSGANIIKEGTYTTSTSVTSAPPSTTDLGSPVTSSLTVLSSNRFKLDSATRIRKASGSYGLSVVSPRTTANTIYIGENNLFEGQALNFSAKSGGAFPTTTTGIPEPDTSLSQSGTLKQIFNSVVSTMDTVKTTMGSDHVPFYFNNNNNYIPLDTSNSIVNGGRYYYYFRLRYDRIYAYNAANGAITNTLSTDYGSTLEWRSGEVYDPFKNNANFAGKGFYAINTLMTYLQETDNIVMVKQIPKLSDLVINSQTPKTAWWTQQDFYFYNGGLNFVSDNINNSRSNWTSIGGGWNYTYSSSYLAPNSTYHGSISVTIVLDNDSYPGYESAYPTDNPTWYNNNNYEMMPFTTPFKLGQSYMITAIIPVKAGSTTTKYGAGSTGTLLNSNTIITNIVNNIASTFINPSFSVGTINSVNAKLISGNSNRIGLKNSSGTRFNFTNNGSSNLLLETDEFIGALDGYYTTSGNTNPTSIGMSVGNLIPPRILPFDSGDLVTIGVSTYFNVNRHKFSTGQKLTFNDVSGTTIAGITSGTEYFTYVYGPNHIGVSTLLSSAESGQIIGVSVSGIGTYNFSTSTISGISSATGSVSLTQNSNLVTGTDTLFKRFYKAGDILTISKGSPAQYEDHIISTITDDSELFLTDTASSTVTDVPYYVKTNIFVRPDGSFLHRPFDGGVEIDSGTSPNSSIVRQTRKYFRYQSGKGIQGSIAINFNPPKNANSVTGVGTTATVTTEYPHGISVGDIIIIRGNNESTYNGSFQIIDSTDFTFKYNTLTEVTSEITTGYVEYNIDGWRNSLVKCGLFDYQNGMFYEYDGQDLYAVRRSSVQQLTGSVRGSTGTNILLGTNTAFSSQLNAGDFVVIRGTSYRITSVENNTEIHIQPSYVGENITNAIVTKTVDTKVPQSQWSIDKADGTGPSKFNLNIKKIQMAYIDYSWYGAGKIRFGFKDNKGHIKYMHEFIHNNIFDEAYMRSGNIPARYEIENKSNVTYSPPLFHWGTSVIMDGRFDDDKAYLFTAASNTYSLTNGDTTTATTNESSESSGTLSGLYRGTYNYITRQYDFYLRMRFPVADASKFTAGTPLYSSGQVNDLNGEGVDYITYAGSNVYVYIFIGTGYRNTPPVSHPEIANSAVINIGAPASGQTEVEIVDRIPILSIRLAPSVDNNITGKMGARDIVNRMQLQLKSLGVTLSHDSIIDLVLNGNLSNINFNSVNSPSLSQLVTHSPTDKINGGATVYSLRASGGQIDSGTNKRLTVTSDFDLSGITDMGNSILGGDRVFPDGPDILTVTIKPIDTTSINSVTPYTSSARISWTESQA